MLAAFGRMLQGPPLPIIGVLTLLQLVAVQAPVLLFGLFLVGIIAAFLVLTRSLHESGTIVAASAILYTLVRMLFSGDAIGFMIPLIYLVAPASLALILRQSKSLSLAILGGFAGAWAVAVVLGLLPLGLEEFWASTLREVHETASASGAANPFANLPMEWLGGIATTLLMASLALLATLMMLLARAGQSALAEESFFAAEFRAVRYGRIADLGFLLVLAVTVTLWLPEPFMAGLAVTFIGAFLFPGIAAIHRLSDRISFPLAVLVPFYALLLIVQEVILAAALLGAVGDLLGWPAQGARRPGST